MRSKLWCMRRDMTMSYYKAGMPFRRKLNETSWTEYNHQVSRQDKLKTATRTRHDRQDRYVRVKMLTTERVSPTCVRFARQKATKPFFVPVGFDRSPSSASLLAAFRFLDEDGPPAPLAVGLCPSPALPPFGGKKFVMGVLLVVPSVFGFAGVVDYISLAEWSKDHIRLKATGGGGGCSFPSCEIGARDAKSARGSSGVAAVRRGACGRACLLS